MNIILFLFANSFDFSIFEPDEKIKTTLLKTQQLNNLMFELWEPLEQMHNRIPKENSVNYKIIPSCNIIIEQYNGPILMQDIIDIKKEISSHSNYSPNFNVIMDFEYSDLVFNSSKLIDYIEFANGFNKIYGKRKTAFLTNTPNEVVLTTIFGLVKGDLPIDSNTFSTFGAIASWFGLSPLEYEQIETELKRLKNKNNQNQNTPKEN